MARTLPASQREPTRIAIDHGTSGTSAAAYFGDSNDTELVPVGYNVDTNSANTRFPAQMQVTQFADRVDIDAVGFDGVSKLLDRKAGNYLMTRTIESPKLLLDPVRCGHGQARQDAFFLRKVGVSAWDCFRAYMKTFLEILKKSINVDSIETVCLTVPAMYAVGDSRSVAMQTSMANEIALAVKHAWGENYRLDDKLDFESEPVAVMAHLAAQKRLGNEDDRVIVVIDAGGSTMDVVAAIPNHGALVFITKAGSASSGTHYLWSDELRKACASDEQTYNFARSAIENMDEAKDIPNCNITKERVLTMVQNSYHRGIEISENTFLALKRRGHRPPQVILVGRALGRNRMVRKCVEDKLKPLLEKIFYGQDVPEIRVPEGADVGVSVCRGAALPYDSDPVKAFTEATVAVCYQADGDDLPAEVRGRDNALVVIKESGIDAPSAWHSCEVDGAPDKFEVQPFTILSAQKPHEFVDKEQDQTLYFYPKSAGLTMNALIIDLTGFAKKGDLLHYRLRRPGLHQPTKFIVEVECPNGLRTKALELIRDRERLQFRPWRSAEPEGVGNSVRDEALQGAARDADGDVYSVPNSEASDRGPDSTRSSPRANKRKRPVGGDDVEGRGDADEGDQRRRRLPS